jgi:hypothetical protein
MYDDLVKATATLHEIRPERGGRGFGRGPAGPPTLASVRTQIARLERSVENADEAPTSAQAEALEIAEKPLAGLLEQWQQLKATSLKALNDQLKTRHLAVVTLDPCEFERSQEDELEMGDEEQLGA